MIFKESPKQLEDVTEKVESDVDLNNKKVWDVTGTQEYKDITNAYRELYGVLSIQKVPQDELFGDYKRKMEESIACGYDLLAKEYGLTSLFDWIHTKEYEELTERYKEAFNADGRADGFPLYQMGGTFQQLVDIVNKSIEDGTNHLPKYYGWNNPFRIW